MQFSVEKPRPSYERPSILRGCFLPKTSSTTADRFPPTALDNVRYHEETPRALHVESPRFAESPKNLRGSSRFFVQTGAWRSLAEEARSSVCEIDVDMDQVTGGDTEDARSSQLESVNTDQESINTEAVELPPASVAVVKHSLEPEADFRESIMEMLESRLERNLAVDWKYLEELVLCYMELNEKSSALFFSTVEILLHQASDHAYHIFPAIYPKYQDDIHEGN